MEQFQGFHYFSDDGSWGDVGCIYAVGPGMRWTSWWSMTRTARRTRSSLQRSTFYFVADLKVVSQRENNFESFRGQVIVMLYNDNK